MKRLLLLVPLILILLAGLCAPVQYSGADELKLQEIFIESADGDSLTYTFSDTLDGLGDDVLHFMDAFDNGTLDFADSGTLSEVNPSADYTKTHSLDGDGFGGALVTSVEIWFSFGDTTSFEGFTYSSYAKDGDAGLTTEFNIWNFDSSSWVDNGDITDAYSWVNGTIYDPDYWNSTHIGLQIDPDGIASANDMWDYCQITLIRMTNADSSHYAESFSVVSDWTTSSTSIATDTDISTITENGAGTTGQAYAALSSSDYHDFYYDFYIYSMTATSAALEFYDGSDYYTLCNFTAAGHYQGIILQAQAATVQRIGFWIGSNGGNIKPDFLRISPHDEIGFSHDGSTTYGLSSLSNLNAASDGDKLTLTATSSTGSCYLYFDTTTTKLNIDPDHYPFLHFDITSTTNSYLMTLYFSDNTFSSLTAGGYQSTTGNRYWNARAIAGSLNLKFIYMVIKGTLVIDNIELFGIGNHTYSGSGVTVADYLYVSGGTLYSSVSSGSITLDNDPLQSIASTAYHVYNLSADASAPEFSMYVSAWSAYSDDTRGATSTGTVTDWKLRFDATESLTNLKFIEDATAPSVVRSFVNPIDADDSESVTLSAVVTDTVEVYTVKINALVYPAGFSDIDYSMTEQSSNLWKYSFSTMTAGHYTFLIVASDGANTNDNTEYAYIDFEVRLGEITITPITFFGVGEDFTQMQMSFKINKDCTFTIYEASASYAISDTHTGSVSAGWSNIAWDKISVTDTAANFSIKFVNGTLSTWVNGSYSIAQTTFYIERAEQKDDLLKVYLSGRITKLGAYAVYNANTSALIKTGTITSLDFSIYFEKWIVKDERGHDFAIKFTNGSQSCWYNGTYYGTVEEKGGSVYVAPPFTVEFWLGILVCMSAVVGVGMLVQKGNIPNYGGR